MIQSMTGFGKASGEFLNKKITIEIKSLNGKQADISTKISVIYKEKELEIRNEIAQRLERGKIEVSLSVDNSERDYPNLLNKGLVMSYLIQIQELADELKMSVPANVLETVLRLPDTLKTDNYELSPQEWAVVRKILNQAMDVLQEFRQQEGKMLDDFFRLKINNIAALLNQIPQYEQQRIEKVRERISDELANLCESMDFDKNRFEQEMIYYIDKLDINEEKSRLSNHLDYFIETLDQNVSQGKKLGFIAQEMGREINTLGSKANHSQMQKIVVMMKDELEQIKEQILNVL
ncbi:MAG: YicC family protein [Paludibacter sp.]|nr:YicC family protein [Paludibacter sp.]